MSRRQQRSALRQQKKDENVRINSSTSDWSLELEGKKLQMNMIDKCPFEELIKLRKDRESLDIMEKAATAFADDDYNVEEFRNSVRHLEHSARYSSFLSETEVEESEVEETADDELTDMELLSTLPQGKKWCVRFDDPIGSCDAEMKDSIHGDSMTAIATVSDDSDDATWFDGNEEDGPSIDMTMTSVMKAAFLGIIGETLRRTCSLNIGVFHGARIVQNGTSQFSSTNDGRYYFYLPDHESGGAEVFGTEDKRRGTSTTEKHKDKLQIQVAGEMLATVFHRNVLGTRWEYAKAILEACPNLQAWQTETSRTVYYLVFTHLNLRIAKAVFDLVYLNQIKAGYLPERLKADIMWSHRLRLNHEEDLTKAARLVMCLMLNFRDEFLSGKHYWLPFKQEVPGVAIWVYD